MRYSLLLRRLLSKARRRPKAAILQFPFEILLLIIDNLALHDKFLLSHTCKAFRRITFQQWNIEISHLSLHDKIKFWSGLAYTLPSHWVCPKCCKLHLINTWDLPKIPWIIRQSEQLVPCKVDLSRRICIETYSIHHYHIQLALKLSRLGNIQQQYLAALMTPYRNTRLSFTLSPLRESYTAEPRIINKQFILREEWTISNDTSADLPLFPESRYFYLPVCPHLGFTDSGLRRSRRNKRQIAIDNAYRSNNECLWRRWHEEMTLFKEFTLIEDGISSAFRCPGKWTYNSCLRCRTDFGVMVSPDKRKATIQAWHNFGVEGSPMDINWKANVANERYELFTLSPYLDYAHGSIRELWLLGSSSKTEAGI